MDNNILTYAFGKALLDSDVAMIERILESGIYFENYDFGQIFYRPHCYPEDADVVDVIFPIKENDILQIIKLLLQYDTGICNSYNKLLLSSVKYDFYTVAKFLLETNCMYDMPINSALVGAVRYCPIEFIQLLIDYGADIHTKEKYGSSRNQIDMNNACLMFLDDHINKSKYLLDLGFVFNPKYIMDCITFHRLELFCLLIRHIDPLPIESIRQMLNNKHCIYYKKFIEEFIKVDPSFEPNDFSQ